MIHTAGAAVTTPAAQAGCPSSNTKAAYLSPQQIVVRTVAPAVARDVFRRHHYLHSMPGGTRLCFGAFVGDELLGAASFGVGPLNAHRLVEGARPDDAATLTRLWLDDRLPRNSESRFLGLLLRALRRHTSLKFLVTYADPTAGHVGYIYQASNWAYTGLSTPQPKLDVGDGVPRHLRTVSSALGTHSCRYLERAGLDVRLVPQPAKHRYVYFLDPTWRARLLAPVLPYPKKGVSSHEDPGPAR